MLFTVFTLCTFSSVVDIIIGLENDGYISGFMTSYLTNGEPYLATPYGTAISYWDGTVHYVLYLYMLTAMACRLVISECYSYCFICSYYYYYYYYYYDHHKYNPDGVQKI